MLIGGCSGTQTGVFQHYQTETTTEQVQASKPLDFGGGPGFIPAPPTTTQRIGTMTGNALITVDGARIIAKCAFQGLTKGQKVQVKMSDGGDWVVVSVK